MSPCLSWRAQERKTRSHRVGSLANKALKTAKKMQAILEPAHVPCEHRLQVAASIGISRYPQDGTGVVDLLRNADTALYPTKKEGCTRFKFHSNACPEP
jgi:diguanylate cyclase (GGDEF)-like protein